VNERTSFASCASAFKNAGLVITLNELLTKKLPMFLSRLNEMSGGCKKMVPVSGSFWSNLKFLRIMALTEWLRVKCESEWNAVARGGDPLERQKKGNHAF